MSYLIVPGERQASQSRTKTLQGSLIFNLLVLLTSFVLPLTWMIRGGPEGALYSVPVSATVVLLAAILSLSLVQIRPTRNIFLGLILASGLILARPSLIADQAPFISLIPLAVCFLADGGLRERRTRQQITWAAMVFLAVLAPSFVSQPENFHYLISQAVSAACIALLVTGLRNVRAIFSASIVWLTWVFAWQALAFIIARFTDFAGAFSVQNMAGGRGWTYLISPLGAITAYGPGFSAVGAERLTAWMPEPGLFSVTAAAVLLFAFWLRIPTRFLTLVAALACILCSQSLSGIIIIATGISLHFIVTNRSNRYFLALRGLGWLLLGLAITAVLWGPLGLQQKALTNETSVVDRLGTDGFPGLVRTIFSNPLGTGIQVENGEINLLQSTVVNGVVVLILWTLVYLPFLVMKQPGLVYLLPLHVAIFVTVLTSQPPFYEIWVLMSALCLGLIFEKTRASGEPVVQALARSEK